MSGRSEWVNKNTCSLHVSTFHGMMFLIYFFHIYWDFFMTDTFQRLEAIWMQEQKTTMPNLQHVAMNSLCKLHYICSYFLFVQYALICQRRDFTSKERQIISVFKIQFINCITNLQTFTIMKYENLRTRSPIHWVEQEVFLQCFWALPFSRLTSLSIFALMFFFLLKDSKSWHFFFHFVFTESHVLVTV